MEKEMTTHEYCRLIRYFIALSHDMMLSILARRILAEHALALITSYRVDDYRAVLVEVTR
jgi:EAL domain-containing protein (putative c-di-GMP-specific phosphodiesterase class I)